MCIFDRFKSKKVIKELYKQYDLLNKNHEATCELIRGYDAEVLNKNEVVKEKIELNFEQLENEMLNLGWLFDKHDAHVRDNILTRPFGTKGRFIPRCDWYNKAKLNKEYERSDKSIDFIGFFKNIETDVKLFRQFISLDKNHTKIRKIVIMKLKNYIKELIDSIENVSNKQLTYCFIMNKTKEVNHSVEEFTINDDDFYELNDFDVMSMFSHYITVKSFITILECVHFSVGVKPIVEIPNFLEVMFGNEEYSIDINTLVNFIDEFYQVKVDFK